MSSEPERQRTPMGDYRARAGAASRFGRGRPLRVEGGARLTRSECYSDTAVPEHRPPPEPLSPLHRALERRQAAIAAWRRMSEEERTLRALAKIHRDMKRADREHAAAEAHAQAEEARRISAAMRLRVRLPAWAAEASR